MKKIFNRKSIIAIFICFLVAIIGITISKNLKNNGKEQVNINAILQSKDYNYLPEEARNYIKNYYEETGNVILTEKNKKSNEMYLNPIYVEYLTLSDEERKEVGVIPKDLVIDYVPKATVGETPSETRYSSLDLKYLGKMKNQGRLNICWAMSSTEVAESYLLTTTGTQNNGDCKTFSPRKLDYLASETGITDYLNEFNHPGLDADKQPIGREMAEGGNFEMATIMMASGLGLNDVSWEIANGKGYTENASEKAPLDYDVVYDFEKSEYEVNHTISMPKIDSADKTTKEAWINEVKTYIKQYGSAYVGTVNPQNTDYTKCSATYDNKIILNNDGECAVKEGGFAKESHAMQIIGWDDELPYVYCKGTGDIKAHSNITGSKCGEDMTKVEGEGAWIVRNSWGDDTNYKYLYIAYDSKDLEVAFVADMTPFSERVWDNQYISNGVGNWTWIGPETFTINRNTKNKEKLDKVKVDVTAAQKYKVTVSDGVKSYSRTITTTSPGLYEFDFSSSNITLTEKEYYVTVDGPVYSGVQMFTENLSDETLVDIPETYIDNKIGTQYVTINTRNIDSEEEISFTLYDATGKNAIDPSKYEITKNIVGANKVYLKINIKSDLEADGYIIKANYNDKDTEGTLLYHEGSGTVEDPYIIKTVNQLHDISNDMRAHYKLGADIDLTKSTSEGGDYYNEGLGWQAIGERESVYFSGSLDGAGHKIIGMKSARSRAGLFYVLNGSTIKNLILKDFNIDNSSIALNDEDGSAALAYEIRAAKPTTIQNITINNFKLRTNNKGAALVAYTVNSSGKTTANINISNIFIDNADVSSGTFAGAITSFINNEAPLNIENIYITNGKIASSNDGIGLISGYANAFNNITINKVFNTAKVENNASKMSNLFVQGLALGKIFVMNGDVVVNNFESLESIKLQNIYFSSIMGFANAAEDTSITYNNAILIDNNNSSPNYNSSILTQYVGDVTINNIYSNNFFDALYDGTPGEFTNIQHYDVEDLLDEDLYTSWTGFDENWTFGEVDGIARIPIIADAPFDYTYVNDIEVVKGKTVDIYDFLSPGIDLAKNITWEIDDDSIATIDSDGIITGVAEGETTISIESTYDGYKNDVNLSVILGQKITFKANYDTEDDTATQVLSEETPFKLIANPFNRPGYTFKEWTTKEDGSGEHYDDKAEVSFDDKVTLFAQWEPNEYTITFNANGGEGSDVTEDFVYDTDAKALTANTFTREGYDFLGWATTDDATEAEYEDEEEVKNLNEGQNLTLYAVWDAHTYTITFLSPDSEEAMESQEFSYGEEQALSTNTYTKTGYHFLGWSEDQFDKEPTYTDGQSVKNLTATDGGQIILNAIWEANTYSVEFDANGAEGNMSNETFTYDVAKSLTENDFAKTGYHFLGWSTKADGEVEYENQEEVKNLTSTNEDTVTLYAVWAVNTYKIVFNGNGATSGTVSDQNFTYGTAQNLNENAYVKTGYHFLGWSTEPDGEVEYENQEEVDNLTTTNEDTINLYAVWEANTYTVEFKANGGEGNIEDETFTYDDEKALTANTFTKTGYHFLGWSEDDDATEATYTDEQKVQNLTSTDEDTITLYAVWEANTYTVVFNSNNATSGTVSNQDFTYDTAQNLNENAYVKTGYHFLGWATEADGEVEYEDQEEVNNLSATNEATVNIYAVWAANTYTIEFKTNGGEGNIEDEIFTYGADAKKLTKNTFVKTGYRFLGWSTDDDATEADFEDEEAVQNLTSINEDTITLYAVWAVNTYKVVFNSNNATSGTVSDQDFTYGTAQNLNENAYVKTGYHFLGWATEADGEAEYEDQEEVNNLTATNEATVNIYAVWEANTYTVVFNSNNATSGTVSNQAFTYDEAQNLNENAYVKTGYHFLGWSTEPDGEVEYENQEEVENLTSTDEDTINLYAIWKANTYTVAFNANGAEGEMTSESFTYDEPKTLTENAFERTGYIFKGWSTEANGEVEYEDEEEVENLTSTNEDTVTLYAIFNPIKYNIEFNANGALGDALDPIENVEYDETIKLPANPFTKEGNDFYGWSTNDKATEADFEDEEEVKNLTSTDGETVTLYAIFGLHQYTITFDEDGGSDVSDIKKAFGLEISLPTTSKDGYKFDGWYDDEDIFEDTTMPSKDITLTAHWTPITYEIKFNANDGEGEMENEEFTYDVEKALTANSFTKTGYTFLGWATTADATEAEYEDEEKINNLTKEDEDVIDLYAVWEANEYTVTFKANGAEGDDVTENFTYDEDAKALTANTFTKTGYTFLGWAITDNATEADYEDEEAVQNLATSGNINLYAIWKANEYTIIFDANDGYGEMTPETRTYDDDAKALPANEFAKNGYSFKGWSITSNGSVNYGDKAEVRNLTTEESITLYAIWEINQYTISFNTNGGDAIDPITDNYGETITLPVPTRTGYTFLGWKFIKGYVGETFTLFNDNVELVADWKINKYKVSFNANTEDATGSMEDIELEYDETKNLPANDFKYENHKFMGWATEASGVTIYEDEAEIKNLTTENEATITLYAVWEEYYGITIEEYQYDKENKYIIIPANVTESEYKENIITDEGYTIEVEYKEVDDQNKLYTGSVTKVYKNSDLIVEYTNIVKGDLNGDAIIDVSDLAKLYNHYKGNINMTGIFLKAAYLNNDNIVDVSDLSKLYNYYKGNINKL